MCQICHVCGEFCPNYFSCSSQLIWFCFIKRCYQFLKVLEICLMMHNMLCHIVVLTLHIGLVCCCSFFMSWILIFPYFKFKIWKKAKTSQTAVKNSKRQPQQLYSTLYIFIIYRFVLKNLKPGEAIMIMDYKMKLGLSMRSREIQHDWYGKNGISLHV